MDKIEVKQFLDAALRHIDKVIPCKCEDSEYYLHAAIDSIKDVLAMYETKKK